ncbi:MAG: ABC transporter permease [Phycisphaerae bacterium]
MNGLLQDIRFAARDLTRSPGFTICVVLTLALGIGVNTAIFSVVNAVVLRPLDFASPEELVVLSAERRPVRWPVLMRGVDLPNFRDWQAQSDAFTGLGAFTPIGCTLSGTVQPERLEAALVTGGFFTALGVKPALGRLLTDDDVDGNNGNVAMLGSELWHRQFGADPAIVGQSILLDQESYVVVGVLPRFRFPYHVKDAQLWMPVPAISQIYCSRGSSTLSAIGRLKPGVTPAQAQAQMDGIAARLAQEHPDINNGYRVQLTGLQDSLTGRSRSSLWMLLGAVGLVLLIACGNVANLFLSHGLGRKRELAIRAAMGAGRLRLARQLLTESTLLGVLGGALGCLLAFWGRDALMALLPGDIPRLDEVAIDGRVLSFSLVVAVLTGVLFGLPAAISVTRVDLQSALKSGTRQAGAGAKHRLQNSLVVSEVAVATALLIGAGLLIRSFWTVAGTDPGYATEGLLTFQMDLGATTPYPQRADVLDGICQRLRALPAVREVSVSNGVPLTDTGVRTGATIVDGVDSRSAKIPMAGLRSVSPEYFSTFDIPLLRGRLFDDADARGKLGVMVIDEMLARKYWPTGNPIGQRLRPGATVGHEREYEIIGVVGNVRDDGLDVAAQPNMYVPYRQFPAGSVVLILHSERDPLALVGDIRRTMAELTTDDAPFAFATMQQYLSRSVAHRRYPMLLLGLFATLALTLAAVGIYGVLAFSVSQRTHELGVRLALGARAGQVLQLVLRQGLWLAIIGVGLGLVGAYAGTRVLRAWLFGVQPTDTATFAGAAALLIGVVLVACFIPARRATKVDPLAALRCE